MVVYKMYIWSIGEWRQSWCGVGLCGQSTESQRTLEPRIPCTQLLAQRRGLPGRLQFWWVYHAVPLAYIAPPHTITAVLYGDIRCHGLVRLPPDVRFQDC